LKPDSIGAVIRSFTEEDEGKYRDGQQVCVCATVVSRTNKTTRNGDHMAFVTVEDGTGSVEIVVFPKVLSKLGHLLTVDSPVSITGKISAKDDEDPKILMNDGAFLSQNGKAPSFPRSRAPKPPKKDIRDLKLYLKVPGADSEEFRRVSAFLSIFRGTVPVVLYDSQTKKYSALKGSGAAVNEFTVNELREILGDENVVIK